jgi:predicted amidophosphoribosyltransferase
MEALQNTPLLAIILSSVCLVAIWWRWRKAHPRCACCRKHIRRAFLHCPWCGLPQVHLRRVPVMRRRASRQQWDTLVAQEAAMPPHRRRRTVVLPTSSQPQAQRGDQHGTVLVPELSVSSHVLVCAQCQLELHRESQQCWYCGSTTFTWRKKKRR